MSEVRRLPWAAIKLDPAIQQRVEGISKDVVGEYADAMRAGDEFPPVVVFSTDGVVYHLGDGFHRFEAYRLAHPDAQEIDCELHSGDHDDALLFACGANASHGLRRSNADKRKAVLLLVKSKKWSQWSDRQIARNCNVSHPYVAKIRSDHLETFPDAGKREGAATVPPPLDVGAADAPAVPEGPQRTFKRSGKSLKMRTERINSGRTASTQNVVGPRPKLDSHAWSMAAPQEASWRRRRSSSASTGLFRSTGIQTQAGRGIRRARGRPPGAAIRAEPAPDGLAQPAIPCAQLVSEYCAR